MKALIQVVALLVGALATLFGLLNLTAATLGVGLIAFACLCGIVARVAQAAAHEDTRRKDAAFSHAIQTASTR